MQRRESYGDLLPRDTATGTAGASSPSTRRVATTTSFLTCGTGQTRRTPETARRIATGAVAWAQMARCGGPLAAIPSAFGFSIRTAASREEQQRASHLCCYLWRRGITESRDFELLTPAGQVTAHILENRGAHRHRYGQWPVSMRRRSGWQRTSRTSRATGTPPPRRHRYRSQHGQSHSVVFRLDGRSLRTLRAQRVGDNPRPRAGEPSAVS